MQLPPSTTALCLHTFAHRVPCSRAHRQRCAAHDRQRCAAKDAAPLMCRGGQGRGTQGRETLPSRSSSEAPPPVDTKDTCSSYTPRTSSHEESGPAPPPLHHYGFLRGFEAPTACSLLVSPHAPPDSAKCSTNPALS